MTFQNRFNPDEYTILQQRAARLARQVEEDDNEDLINTLSIVLNQEQFAFPLDELIAILDDVNITPMPCVPSFVAGIANVRGRVTPVLDMATLLGLPGGEVENPMLVVATAGDERTEVAFRVDAVGELVVLGQSQIKPLPDDFETENRAFFTGISDSNYIVINIKAILGSESIVIDEKMS